MGDDNFSKPPTFHRLTLAEFARLSSSRQLMLLAIGKAQLSSGKALDEAEKRGGAASPDDSSESQ